MEIVGWLILAKALAALRVHFCVNICLGASWGKSNSYQKRVSNFWCVSVGKGAVMLNKQLHARVFL